VTIDEYIAELEWRLPRLGRRRSVAEAREHLLDSAARHEAGGLARADAERAAVDDFGPVALVARRFASETAVRETRLATALALGAAALFVFPLYVVPENTLPPAQWAEKPRDIFVLQTLTVALWLFSVTLAAVGTVLSWTRASRFTAVLLAGTTLAILGSVLASAALIVRWFAEVPATAGWPLLAAPLALACLAVGASAAVWTRERRALLE
jgi:hypothetical protein